MSNNYFLILIIFPEITHLPLHLLTQQIDYEKNLH